MIYRKKATATIMAMLFITLVSAQQEPLITQYMFNKVYLNPAAAGTSGAVCASGMARHQWIGMEDMQGNTIYPRTYSLSFDMPVYRIKSGIGLTVQHDAIGFEKQLDIRLLYAYHHVFSNNGMLSGGLSLGIHSRSIDFTKLFGAEYDPLLDGLSQEKGTMTDIGFGLNYQNPRKYYIGFSASNLLGSSTEIGTPEFTLSRHFYLYGGYHITLINEKEHTLIITPGFQGRATIGSVQFDINAIATYNDRFWGGLIYRFSTAAGIMAGIKYYGFQAGVAWEYTHNKTARGGNRSSVEVFLKYCYPIFPKEPRRSGYNTRNL